jgi:hypothetical protein
MTTDPDRDASDDDPTMTSPLAAPFPVLPPLSNDNDPPAPDEATPDLITVAPPTAPSPEVNERAPPDDVELLLDPTAMVIPPAITESPDVTDKSPD